jgi:hypothetical protein
MCNAGRGIRARYYYYYYSDDDERVASEHNALIVRLRRMGWSQTKIGTGSGLPSRASRRRCYGLLKAGPVQVREADLNAEA